jgi:hypothetical protein
VSKIGLLEQWIEREGRRPRFWLIAVAVLLAVQISPWLYPTVDGCLYLRTIRDFLQTDNRLNCPCYVPPGFLPFLAPAFLFGDRPFLAIAVLQWLFALALIGGLYVWLRRQFPATAVLFTVFVMVNISVWTFYRRPLKEIASMALLMWTVNLMHVLLAERRLLRVAGLTAVVAILTAYLTLMRYSEITLAAGFSLAAFVQVRRQVFGWGRALAMSAFVGTTAAAALLGWMYYDSTHGGGSEYLKQLTKIYAKPAESPGSTSNAPPRRPIAPIAANAPSVAPTAPVTKLASAPASNAPTTPAAAPQAPSAESVVATTPAATSQSGRLRQFAYGATYRINDIACLLVPGLWKSTVPALSNLSLPVLLLPIVLFAGLCAVIALGWQKIVCRKVDVLALALPIYVLLYSHWVVDQPGGRLMLPMLPILVACTWYGLGAFVRRPTVVFGLLLAAHLAQSSLYWLAIDAPRAYRVAHNWPTIDRFADEIQRRPGRVVVEDEMQSECQGLWYELHWGYRVRGIRQEGIGPQVAWVVNEAGTRPIDGFSVDLSEGSLQLLHRNPPTQPTAATATPAATNVVLAP